MALETGSARNTPFTPSPHLGSSTVRGATITALRSSAFFPVRNYSTHTQETIWLSTVARAAPLTPIWGPHKGYAQQEGKGICQYFLRPVFLPRASGDGKEGSSICASIRGMDCATIFCQTFPLEKSVDFISYIISNLISADIFFILSYKFD